MSKTSCVQAPKVRVRQLTPIDVRPKKQYVLYWMNAFRRRRYNFALQHACALAEELGKPLVIIEALRMRYRWASDRFHRYVIDGMIDNERDFSNANVVYYPFLETADKSGSGFVEACCRDACVLVADDYPCFFHPILYQRIVRHWDISVQLIDSNGLIPLRAADRTFPRAHSFRRFMQQQFAEHYQQSPVEDALAIADLPKPQELPKRITQKWPRADLARYSEGTENFGDFRIDHSIGPVAERGGATAALKRLDDFVTEQLVRYDDDRNVPDLRGASRLSGYLHFGFISAHEVFNRVVESTDWDIRKLRKPNGSRIGFWGLSPEIEAYLDELITWREVGYNMSYRETDYDRYESLPDWARTTLTEHAEDPREFVYSLEQLENAETHDRLWNAAQRELVRDGRIHNYLRMLWGKKILQWSTHPREALAAMIELNNKYAIDGRDPNSYSGIFWVMGRYDRAWGPEREIFGKIRYMTSESTMSKFKTKNYLEQYK